MTRRAHLVIARHRHVVHAHVTALDDVQVLRHAIGRIDDRRADREVRQLCAPGDELEVLARHARERLVPAEKAQGRFDDQGGCSHARTLHPPCRH